MSYWDVCNMQIYHEISASIIEGRLVDWIVKWVMVLYTFLLNISNVPDYDSDDVCNLWHRYNHYCVEYVVRIESESGTSRIFYIMIYNLFYFYD